MLSSRFMVVGSVVKPPTQTYTPVSRFYRDVEALSEEDARSKVRAFESSDFPVIIESVTRRG